MSKSPLAGKSPATRNVLIGAFGCLLAVVVIAGIILMILFGGAVLSDQPLLERVSVEQVAEIENNALDLLAEEDIGQDEGDPVQSELENETTPVVLEVDQVFEEGYANFEWLSFLEITAGEGTSPAQLEAGKVRLNLTLDSGKGIFRGGASGDLSGEELLHTENGQFTVSGMEGLITPDPEGSGYLLAGAGTLNLSLKMEEYYTDGAGKTHFYDRKEVFNAPVEISGTLMLLNSIWELDLRGAMDNGTQSFNLSCRDCPVGTWEP